MPQIRRPPQRVQTLSDVVSVTRPGPSIDPGPPRDFASVNLPNSGRRLGLLPPFINLPARDPTALPRLQERRGLLPFFLQSLGTFHHLPISMAATDGLEARRRILFFSLLVAEHPLVVCWGSSLASMASRGSRLSV